jgi:hypothetical protein
MQALLSKIHATGLESAMPKMAAISQDLAQEETNRRMSIRPGGRASVLSPTAGPDGGATPTVGEASGRDTAADRFAAMGAAPVSRASAKTAPTSSSDDEPTDVDLSSPQADPQSRKRSVRIVPPEVVGKVGELTPGAGNANLLSPTASPGGRQLRGRGGRLDRGRADSMVSDVSAVSGASHALAREATEDVLDELENDIEGGVNDLVGRARRSLIKMTDGQDRRGSLPQADDVDELRRLLGVDSVDDISSDRKDEFKALLEERREEMMRQSNAWLGELRNNTTGVFAGGPPGGNVTVRVAAPLSATRKCRASCNHDRINS